MWKNPIGRGQGKSKMVGDFLDPEMPGMLTQCLGKISENNSSLLRAFTNLCSNLNVAIVGGR